MAIFSKKSKFQLVTCDDRLEMIMWDAIGVVDFTVSEGHRSIEDQEKKFKDGSSKVRGGWSRHNFLPSKAIDIAPWPIPENWGVGNKKELARFYFLAGVIKGIAFKYDIPLRWGGDWDGDNNFNDQTFDDLVHFEIL